MDFEINNDQIEGCDKISRIYCKTFNVFQPFANTQNFQVMLNGEIVDVDNMKDIDMSALGLYIGKYVEQEINSSIVQLMRKCCGIKMPKFYCRRDPHSWNKANVVTAPPIGNGKTIKLNAQMLGKDKFALMMIPLGDAYYALLELSSEDESMFDSYKWILDDEFLSTWRRLSFLRNNSAHGGLIVDRDALKENYELFLKFLEYMPQILSLKTDLAPVGYFNSPAEDVTIKPKASKEDEANHDSQAQQIEEFRKKEREERERLPRPGKEEWIKYSRLYKAMDDGDESVIPELNEFMIAYNWFTEVFKGDDGKVGLKHVSGEILVPAIYDEILVLYDCRFPLPSIPVMRNKKVGLVVTDGSGKELTPFIYDDMWCFGVYNKYFFTKYGSKTCGVVEADGKEIIPCIIDKYWDPDERSFIFKSGDFVGLYHEDLRLYLEPIYDDIEWVDLGEPLLFTLNGEQGYVKVEDQSFVPLSLKKTMNMSDDDWDDYIFDTICESYDPC